MKKEKQSFTLIEILVVIVIIGILSSFIFFTINDSVEKAQIAKSKMFAESIRNNLLLNLVSEWKFDDESGTTAVDSWGSNNGTLTDFNFDITDGWQAKSECISGQCLKFDGINDYVDCGNDSSLNITNAMTISAWVKPVTLGTRFGIVEKHTSPTHGWWFNREADNKLRLLVVTNSGTVYASSMITMTTDWAHVIGIYNGTEVRLFINGVDRTGTQGGSGSGNILNDDRTVVIGEARWDDDNFNGSIDEVQIYDAVVSGAQIKENYSAGLNNLLASGNISEIEYNKRINNLSKK